jgi:hypothetical protein
MLKSILLSVLIVFILSSNIYAVWTDKEIFLTSSIDSTEGRITNRVYYKIDKAKAAFLVQKAIHVNTNDDFDYAWSAPSTVPGVNPYAIYQLALAFIRSFYKQKMIDYGAIGSVHADYYCNNEITLSVTCTKIGHLTTTDAINASTGYIAGAAPHDGMNDCYVRNFGIVGSEYVGVGQEVYQYSCTCTGGFAQESVFRTFPALQLTKTCECGDWGIPGGAELDTSIDNINGLLEDFPEGFNLINNNQALVSDHATGGKSTEIPGSKPTVYTSTNPTGNTTNTTGVDPVTGDTTGPVTTDTTGPAPTYGNTDQPSIGNFDTTIEQPEDVTKEQYKQKIVDATTGFIGNVPVVGAIYTLINNIHATSGACDLTFPFKGRVVHLNFCAYTSYFSFFRIMLESCALLYGIMIFLKGA